MIPCMDRCRYEKMEEQFYDYFSQISNMFYDPEGFIDFLNNDTGFFDLPASTKSHCNYKGGLLEHSLNVTKILIDLNYFITNKKYSLKQCIVRGLFHDINYSYSNGYFPFIWVIDDYGSWKANIDLPNNKNIGAYELLSDFINKEHINFDFTMSMMLDFSNRFAKINEPITIYNNSTDMELKLPEGYL